MKPTHVGFRAHVKIASRIVSYRIVSVVHALRKHTKPLRSFLCSTRRSTIGWENFAELSDLSKTQWTTLFALKQPFVVCVKHFANRSQPWWLTLTFELHYFIYLMSVCLHFFLNSLRMINTFMFIQYSDKFCSCHVLERFWSKHYQRNNGWKINRDFWCTL